MEAGNVALTRLSPDENGLIEAGVFASNTLFAGAVEDYFDREELYAFARSLQSFPVKLADEIKFEQGTNTDRFRSYLLIRAFVYDATGHVGVEFKLRTNGAPVHSAFAQFSIQTEAASVNEFGRALAAWIESKNQHLEHTFHRST